MSAESPLVDVKAVSFSAHGKFLLTGEYAVLDDVDALAIPLKLDQRLEITPMDQKEIHWISYNVDGAIWFENSIALDQITNSKYKGEDEVTSKLLEILRTALALVKKVNFNQGFVARTTLDFDRKSGMGTSSTLISMISQWLGCDSYQLQFKCFGGSGYDVACALASSPVIYNYNQAQPRVTPISYQPQFTDQLFFVYLNQKQNSRESIARFDSEKLTDDVRYELSEMPKRFLETERDLQAFQEVIEQHESIISKLIGIPPVKNQLFADYKGSIKSLGGWGGDYVLATGTAEQIGYFKNKGYHTVYRWDEIVS